MPDICTKNKNFLYWQFSFQFNLHKRRTKKNSKFYKTQHDWFINPLCTQKITSKEIPMQTSGAYFFPWVQSVMSFISSVRKAVWRCQLDRMHQSDKCSTILKSDFVQMWAINTATDVHFLMVSTHKKLQRWSQFFTYLSSTQHLWQITLS